MNVAIFVRINRLAFSRDNTNIKEQVSPLVARETDSERRKMEIILVEQAIIIRWLYRVQLKTELHISKRKLHPVRLDLVSIASLTKASMFNSEIKIVSLEQKPRLPQSQLESMVSWVINYGTRIATAHWLCMRRGVQSLASNIPENTCTRLALS